MRVLIADDNVALSQSLATLLRDWKFDPIVVNDGRDALELLNSSGAPSLIILDWMMPGMNGIAICRELRKATGRPYTYVILLTGQGGRQQILHGLNSGADDYLIKPFDSSELRARLNAGKRIVELQEQLLVTQRLLREQATRDSLTNLWNRPMILEILQKEMNRAGRQDGPMAAIMADLDHFKEINDCYGHLVGDLVLQHAAQSLSMDLRPYDAVGRYGGEEFLIVLPGCDEDKALSLAQRLCRRVEMKPVSIDARTVRVTVSMGVAVWDGKATAQDLLRSADKAMYRAKREGRNRVVGTTIPEAMELSHL